MTLQDAATLLENSQKGYNLHLILFKPVTSLLLARPNEAILVEFVTLQDASISPIPTVRTVYKPTPDIVLTLLGVCDSHTLVKASLEEQITLKDAATLTNTHSQSC